MANEKVKSIEPKESKKESSVSKAISKAKAAVNKAKDKKNAAIGKREFFLVRRNCLAMKHALEAGDIVSFDIESEDPRVINLLALASDDITDEECYIVEISQKQAEKSGKKVKVLI